MTPPAGQNDPRVTPSDEPEVPEQDALAQRTPIDPDDETDDFEPVGDAVREADPADVADQHRAVPFDDEGPR